jgi:Mce-associated membrane protein
VPTNVTVTSQPQTEASQPAPEADATGADAVPSEAAEPRAGTDRDHDVDGLPAEQPAVAADVVEPAPRRLRRLWPRSEVSLGLLAGVVSVCALAGLVGWLGLTAYHARAAHEQRQLFLQAARQGALDLTTIRANDVDADVQRVLDASTGKFYDEFKARSADFAAAVRQAQSSSTGTVTEAGIETIDNDTAQVLVSAAVHTEIAQAPAQEPRYWRMRITVKRVDQQLPKVADVEFVP